MGSDGGNEWKTRWINNWVILMNEWYWVMWMNTAWYEWKILVIWEVNKHYVYEWMIFHDMNKWMNDASYNMQVMKTRSSCDILLCKEIGMFPYSSWYLPKPGELQIIMLFQNLNQNPRTLLPKFYGLYCYQVCDVYSITSLDDRYGTEHTLHKKDCILILSFV